MANIKYYPHTFRWARSHRRLTTRQAARVLGITHDELKKIESGKRDMTLTLLRKISQKYSIPLATLLLPQPPTDIKEVPKDYRTIEGKPPTLLLTTLVTIDRVRSFQDKLAELIKIDQALGGPQIKQYEMRGDASELGERERSRVGVTVNEQLGWYDESEAFRQWRKKIENLGVYVYIEDFPIADCRGISLFDHIDLPAIIISRNEKLEVGKIFSLIHEYAHIVFNKPGISDMDQRNNIEAFCNRFAAGFLIPREALERVIPQMPPLPFSWGYDQIKEMARDLKISQQSMALRLEQTGLAPGGFYDEFKINQPKLEAPLKAHRGYPPIAVRRIFALGRRFSSVIISAADKGLISYVDATRLLNIPGNKISDMRKRLQRY